jgi:GNAT superfamily N-acetyltransferase
MKKDSANSEVFIRPATVADSPIILHHRRAMFEDMGDGTPAELDAMEASSGPWLSKALADGSYRGWLAEAAGRVIAGGGVLIYPFPSRPADMRTQRAIVLNVYTEPEYRHRGIARQLMLAILDWLRTEGFNYVDLHASEFGRPLYESLGFKPTNEMRLKL